MRCPECQWNVVTLVLETRKWICKRCKHEWTERNNPGLTSLFDRPAIKTRKVSTKAKKRKAFTSSKKKATARKVGKAKKQR